MGKTVLSLLFLLLFSCAFSQVGTLQFRLLAKGEIRRKAIKEKNVKITVDDTLVKYMLTDRKGFTGYLPLQPGKHLLCIEVKGFKTCTRKNVEVKRAEGRQLRVRLWRDHNAAAEKEEEPPRKR